MKEPDKKPVVRLTGRNGDAFAILGATIRALREAGADVEYIDKYQNEATSGDYNNLLRTTMEYVDVC
ncbi:MAG: hypothetical protein DRO67_00195 [Candidatus Asgardarchaeum californiense]|nr:MAG: hypothetical protein DRO67_00195 [Candidatus Asgardarchaeum californiense]